MADVTHALSIIIFKILMAEIVHDHDLTHRMVLGQIQIMLIESPYVMTSHFMAIVMFATFYTENLHYYHTF